MLFYWRFSCGFDWNQVKVQNNDHVDIGPLTLDLAARAYTTSSKPGKYQCMEEVFKIPVVANDSIC